LLAVAGVALTIAGAITIALAAPVSIVVTIPLGIARAITIALAAPVSIAVSISVAFPAMTMTRAMSALIGERRNYQMREDVDRGEEGARNAQGRKAQNGGDQKTARLRRPPEQWGGSARDHGFGLRSSDGAARGDCDELHRPTVSRQLKRMRGSRSIVRIRALDKAEAFALGSQSWRGQGTAGSAASAIHSRFICTFGSHRPNPLVPSSSTNDHRQTVTQSNHSPASRRIAVASLSQDGSFNHPASRAVIERTRYRGRGVSA
jgi:hypothetical protein